MKNFNKIILSIYFAIWASYIIMIGLSITDINIHYSLGIGLAVAMYSSAMIFLMQMAINLIFDKK